MLYATIRYSNVAAVSIFIKVQTHGSLEYLLGSSEGAACMNNWLELEARFRALALRMRHTRLDDQTGAAGEHWRLAAGFDQASDGEFEVLSELAGSLLSVALKSQTNATEILSHQDPKVRWYRAMKLLSGAHEPGLVAFQTNDAGENLGNIYGGTIHNLPEVAANLCLHLHSRHPITVSWYQRIYEQYGKEIIVGVILILVTALIGLWLS
jgi:hypothetical protein